ncbi:MAG TPA: DinB family protein [Bryobacteraceae bacterium]|nr:DinB family protein [Bryobacteraceae bacterium]
MNVELLRELARHQTWADAEHWKALHGNAALLEDPQIRKRLNHMVMAYQTLQTLARGETPDMAGMKDRESVVELEAAMAQANAGLAAALGTVDFDKMIKLPRGPKGPFEAPAGVLLFQALLHSQHHRGQNASRMRELGATPPMTDFVIWYALGKP